jgi:double-strand break repair protein MRE11
MPSRQRRGSQGADTSDDILRILVATDNHLGVHEKDVVRGNDSFETFEEILQIAKERRADCVLLGGDLFHDNKPSRNSIVKAMGILTRYCLNDDDINFEILSDQSNFTTGKVNFENENVNIGLPVFTIHGNHDDPSSLDNMSAVDVLASANLVNYFGKANLQLSQDGDPRGEVKVQPILIRKGNVKLALYGLGNIRDERMCRLLNSPQGVEWGRPTMYEDEWVNVFVLHQNRVAHMQGAKNVVKESHLPRWLHMVIWGHEHECIGSPWKSHTSGGAFSVLQPGSSVATALSEGESRRKHVFLLEVQHSKWRTVKIPLETVRPFVFDSVVLADQESVNRGNPDTVTDFLTRKVEDMIATAMLGRGSRSPELPLIRLRVDYTGFSTINPQVFAQQFVNKVANPNEILLWQKAVVRKKYQVNRGVPVSMSLVADTRLEDLIGQNLTGQLRLLPELELSRALEEYVQKEEKNAIVETVQKVLQETQDDAQKHAGSVKRMNTADDDDDIGGEEESTLVLEAIESAANRRKEKLAVQQIVNNALSRNATNADRQASDPAAEAAVGDRPVAKRKLSSKSGASSKPRSNRKRNERAAEEDEWDDDSDDEETEEEDISECDTGNVAQDGRQRSLENGTTRAKTRSTRTTRSQSSARYDTSIPARSAALASLRSGPARSTRSSGPSQSTSKWGSLKK